MGRLKPAPTNRCKKNRCRTRFIPARKNGGFSGGYKTLPYKKIVIFWASIKPAATIIWEKFIAEGVVPEG